MKEITEMDLHLFLLNKSLLNDDTIFEIERKLSCDESLLEELKGVKEFYELFQSLENENCGIYTLKEFLSLNSSQNVIKLAAMENSGLSDQNYIKTFLSGTNYLLARLFYFQKEKEYRLYIIDNENMDRVANCVVWIAKPERFFLSNETGIVTINEPTIRELDAIKIIVPVARFDYDMNEMIGSWVKSNMNKDDEIMICRIDSVTNCTLRLKNVEEKRQYALIFTDEKENKYLKCEIAGNSFSFVNPEIEVAKILIINKSEW